MTMEIVDDSNPRIEYRPDSWTKNSNSSVDYHCGTSHSTTTKEATIQFHFNGTFIQVFGAVSPAPFLQAQYKVDGQVAEQPPPIVEVNTPNQILYQSELTPGNHTLNITIDGNDHSFMFSLDYFVVLNTNDNPSSSACPPSETTVVSTAAPENVLPHSKSKVNIGGVVGGVIAALVFLATVALFFLHWRRRQRKVAGRHSITPFHIVPQMSQLPPASGPLPAIPPTDPRSPSRPASDGPLSHTGATLASPISDAPQSQALTSPISDAPLSHTGGTLLSPLSDDDLPPPFVAGNSRSDVARHPSMYKPRSMESLPPPEYGYGGGLMLHEWSRPQGHHGQ